MTGKQSKGALAPSEEARLKRQAAALRANLKRRKQQARHRAGNAKAEDSAAVAAALRDAPES
jgi:hypothetical protein